jgi:hypothetical protein
MRFSDDDRNIVSIDEEGNVQVWDLRQSAAVMSLDCTLSIKNLTKIVELGELYGLDVSNNIYAASGETSIIIGYIIFDFF